ncbi:MAG: hypothetical protein C5B59_11095 [Bacteroidetes bacterium]|nr:MAG: hypothetical protein C5B59_11095 [Bacteroidota bacterium]
METKDPKWFKKYSFVLILLLLLVLVFCLYFLKYVPEQQADFHRDAFLELNNIENAITSKDAAYRNAVKNHILSGFDHEDFNFEFKANEDFRSDAVKPGNVIVRPTQFCHDSTDGFWELTYSFCDTSTDSKIHKPKKPRFKKTKDTSSKESSPLPCASLSKNLDSLMTSIVAIYKDVFDDCVLILDDSSTRSKRHRFPNGTVIYQSGDLSMDQRVRFDSASKISSELGLPALIDTKIEGNDYKLFLHPFQIGGANLIVGGLISQSHYNSYRSIPLGLVSMAGILILLILIHLPIIKIYSLGPGERIRDIDIRLIFVSFFVAAFVGFFLFSEVFLTKQTQIQNEAKLGMIADKIQNAFEAEIGSMVSQLKIFDSTYRDIKSDAALDSATKLANRKYSLDSVKLDSMLTPSVYPYLESIFWINKEGKWTNRWMFRKSLRNASLIDVRDRAYFKDFINDKAILLSGKPSDSFTLQPTLSKLDGEYIASVLIRSHADDANPKESEKPYLIGMGTKLYSVYKVILPPGFGFSITDAQGGVKFDSKPGRALLSNILKDMPDPSTLQQTIKYRTRNYFDGIVLRGRRVAMLSRPLKGFQYQLLVYYNLGRSDSFQSHVIGFTSVLAGSVLALLILTALINQWSKRRFNLLQGKSMHFDWLHPSDLKQKSGYYSHLIKWMLLLFGIYLVAWIVIEKFFYQFEITLLLLSILFPFYIAIHYYELREEFYAINEISLGGSRWWISKPSWELRTFQVIILVFINCFVGLNNISLGKALILIFTQIFWVLFIWLSLVNFKNKSPRRPSLKIRDVRASFPAVYSYTIVLGVILISIIPASGIFWTLLRQETSLKIADDQLGMAKQIDQRRQEISDDLRDFKFAASSPDSIPSIDRLQYSYGIYIPGGSCQSVDPSFEDDSPFRPSREYVSIHRNFLAEDTLAQALSKSPYVSDDGSWEFRLPSNSTGARLIYNYKSKGDYKTFYLEADSSAATSAAGLMFHDLNTHSALFSVLYFGLLAISAVSAVFLTNSLGRRIFLFDLQKDVRFAKSVNSPMEKLYQQIIDLQTIRIFIYLTTSSKKTSPSTRDQLKSNFLRDDYPTLNDIYVFEKNLSLAFMESGIVRMMELLNPFYERVWMQLSKLERFLLYDFAVDGFANYKTTRDLYALQSKGILFFEDLRLCMMTISFQEFVLLKKNETDIQEYVQTAASKSTIKKFRTPLLIGLAAIGIFLFVTQDAVYQKIMALLTSATSLFGFISDLFKKTAK